MQNVIEVKDHLEHHIQNEPRQINAQWFGQIRILQSILGCYFSILDHYSLSNILLCLTASSYRMKLLHLSQEHSTA
jgi:hypothetical protein